MRLRVLVVLLAAALIAFHATPASAANLLANPGFESGLSGWTCSGAQAVSSPAHGGAQALQATPQGGDLARCQQVVTVRPSTAYQLSAWVQGSYVFLGATGTGGTDPQTWGSPGTTWTQLKTSFTTGASTTSVTVYLNGWYGQGAYLADDVVLDGPGGTPDTQAPTVPGNLRSTGVTSSSVSLAWNASTDNTALHVQDYNSGPIRGLDDQYHTMGGHDFHVAMTDMLLSGFPIMGNPANVFPPLRQDQVAIGLPASVNAGNGFTSVAEVQKAFDCLAKGSNCGPYRPRGVYPNLRGLMTWSINWDRYNGQEFSRNHRAYLDALN